VGNVLVARDGSLVFEDGTPPEDAARILSALSERGFCAADADAYGREEAAAEMREEGKAEEAPHAPPENAETGETSERAGESRAAVAVDGLVVQMPLGGFTETGLDNLRKLVAAKARLIKKSLGADELPIEKDGDTLCFPWLGADASPEKIAACTQFVAALCAMAKKQQRVLTVDKPIENEKYAFRCFLLRLGFIGEEYAEARKVLLRDMSGNGSMKSGERKRGGASGGAAAREDAEAAANGEPLRAKSRFSLKNLLHGLIAPR
jgi:hypothetical protein